MIVHPDFLDHWKTKALIDATGDKAAPLMVIRLWGFCQIQRRSVFESNLNLKAICRADNLTSEAVKDLLITCGFLDCDENEQKISVHQFEHSNKALRNSQLNGLKGGRPIKPMGSQRVIRGLSVGSHKSTEAKLRVGSMEPIKRSEDGPEPKGDPANTIKFGQLCREIGNKLKSGEL